MAEKTTTIETPPPETDGKAPDTPTPEDLKDRAQKCLDEIEETLKKHNCRIHAFAALEPEAVGGGSKILISSKTSWGIFPNEAT